MFNFFFQLVGVLLVVAVFSDAPWAARGSAHCKLTNSGELRPHSVSITEFGAVGDGVTLNTKAFQNAIFYLNSFADKGGAKLFVPAGRWLTGSFDLISHLTLWLDKNAVILGSTVSLHLHPFAEKHVNINVKLRKKKCKRVAFALI
jgi:hypothetical protein